MQNLREEILHDRNDADFNKFEGQEYLFAQAPERDLEHPPELYRANQVVLNRIIDG